jgi:nucleotide-binding universal stress UspA family protein
MDAASMADTAARLLEREVAQCERDTSAMPIEQRVEIGFPAALLVELSATASMIVVGSRGHRRASGLLLGSVSDQVTHHAAGPVVVVPPGAVDDAQR